MGTQPNRDHYCHWCLSKLGLHTADHLLGLFLHWTTFKHNGENKKLTGPIFLATNLPVFTDFLHLNQKCVQNMTPKYNFFSCVECTYCVYGQPNVLFQMPLYCGCAAVVCQRKFAEVTNHHFFFYPPTNTALVFWNFYCVALLMPLPPWPFFNFAKVKAKLWT